MPHHEETPSNLSLLMIGFALPDALAEALCREEASPPAQTHTHVWSIIAGIEAGAGVAMDLISTPQVSDYPRSPRLGGGYARWARGGGTLELAPFVNIFLLKHLTRAVSCLALTARWLWRRRKRPRTLLLYGVTSAHLLPALLAARLFGARIAAIATDLPSSPPIREGMLRHTVRRLDRALILAALRRLDGLIVLSPHLAADLAPGVPALLMEGIVPPAVADRPAVPAPPTDPAMRRAPGVCTLMYAGALLESYGIGALLDAFAHLEGPGWRLWITGKGEMGDAVRAAAARDPRIIYWGFVATDTVAALLREADILVNPRPSDPLARYCFQSKLIEYMASGRPSVVHRVPSIPDEYTPYLVFPEAETVEGLAATIRALRAEGEVALTARGAAARRFVLEHKDYRRQGARMWAFLRDLGCKWPTMEPRPMSNPPG